MEIVKLNNSTEETIIVVGAAMIALENLMHNDPVAFYDLVMLCRNPLYEAATKDKLNKLNLIKGDGSVHNSIVNVVLSAVSGDGIEMVLSSPHLTKNSSVV